MRMSRFISGSLARRFTLAAAALATAALLLIGVSSWWLVSAQHESAMELVARKEAEYHAASVSSTLHAVDARLTELANSSILATGLVDSLGKDLYLAPYLNGVQQINGVPVQILFTDFEGKEIAANGATSFTPAQRDWLRERLKAGTNAATILPGPRGPELVAAELLDYSRTRTPEGAVLYKLALKDLRPGELAQLAWGAAGAAPKDRITVAISSPELYRHLALRIIEPQSPPAGLLPQYGAIFFIGLILLAVVLVIGSRLAIALTADLRRLEAFSRSVTQGGFGAGRAELKGSDEVVSLARSINHMIDRLTEQHTQLQNETEMLHQLANTIPQLAWIADAEHRLHWFNDRWQAYTGQSSQALADGGWRRVHDPRELDAVTARLKSGFESGEAFQLTCRLRGADGEWRPFFLSAAPLRDASGRIAQWFGTHTDVSQLEKAERAVRESEERLREGMIAARMVVWGWDLASGEVQMSSNAADVLGCAPGGPADWRIVHAGDADAFRQAVTRAVAGEGQFVLTMRLVRPDNGALVWSETRGKVEFDEAGAARSIRGILLDVTERHRAEEALLTANRRKDEFLAMLAHELRNPLAPISTAAQLLRIGHLSQTRMEEVSDIVARQVEHMTSLVDDLLDVSRVTRGLVKLHREPVEIGVIIDGAIEQVRPLIDARRHKLSVRPPPHPLHVAGDKTRLVQVIANLLSNSAKYTPDGGEIVLQAEAVDERMEISVSDNGIGIAPELLPHVFELFTQAERSPDRSQGGLGLGLALVKSMVELHGGHVTAHSAGTGRGSRFVVCLPRLAEAPQARPRQERRRAGPAGGKPLHVMVVDDNADAARSLALLMEARHYRVTVESDALSALERARTDTPDVFLLDIGLPVMDGYELARRLRELPAAQRALFVAVTGYGQTDDIERSRAAGFSHHFVKPADPARLGAALADHERWLRHAERVAQTSA